MILAGIAGALIAVPLAAAGNAVAQHLGSYTDVGEDDPDDALDDDIGPPPHERDEIHDDSPLAGSLDDADLGRLNVATDMGLNDDGTCYSELYTFGGRGFSVWNTAGEQVFDSGADFERIAEELRVESRAFDTELVVRDGRLHAVPAGDTTAALAG